MRIATSQKERWLIEAAEWNPEFSSKYRTNRSIGRPRKRWEDDINEFLKQIEDETENLTESSNHINNKWINTAKDRGRWTLLEENYTKNSVTRTRRNSHNRPARYVNGVKLNDEEIADIHNGRIPEQRKMKERTKMVCSSFLKAAAAPHPAPHASPNEAPAVSSRANVKNFFLKCDASRTT